MYALGTAATAASSDFIVAVCAKLGWEPRSPDFFGLDIELDAICAAFTASAEPESKVYEDRRGRLEMDGFKIDAVLAYRRKTASGSVETPPEAPTSIDLVLLQARNKGKWTARRSKRISERLRRIFGADGNALSGANPHFVALGGEPPESTAMAAWPLWMAGESGVAHWLPLERSQREVSLIRCDRNLQPSPGGAYWKLE